MSETINLNALRTLDRLEREHQKRHEELEHERATMQVDHSRWVYCFSHVRPHTYGWCTAAVGNCVELEAETLEDAVKECRLRRFPIYSECDSCHKPLRDECDCPPHLKNSLRR